MKKLVLVLMACFCIMACEKEVIDYMENYYTESMGLQSVGLDSVKSFSAKVNNYVTEYPEEKEHPLYPKIQSNIKSAMLKITIECDTTWDGTIDISFGFGGEN